MNTNVQLLWEQKFKMLTRTKNVRIQWPLGQQLSIYIFNLENECLYSHATTHISTALTL